MTTNVETSPDYVGARKEEIKLTARITQINFNNMTVTTNKGEVLPISGVFMVLGPRPGTCGVFGAPSLSSF